MIVIVTVQLTESFVSYRKEFIELVEVPRMSRIFNLIPHTLRIKQEELRANSFKSTSASGLSKSKLRTSIS